MSIVATLIQLHRQHKANAAAFDAMPGRDHEAQAADEAAIDIEKQIDAALIERVGVGLRELGDIG